jgi:hypothetical protein
MMGPRWEAQAALAVQPLCQITGYVTGTIIGYAPWNVIESGQIKVQRSGEIGRAIKKLLLEIDPNNWRSVRP